MTTITGHKSVNKIDFSAYRPLLPLFAGGLGAAVGQAVTCPLDVVQTRLQSTYLSFHTNIIGVGNVGKLYSPNNLTCIRYFKTLITYMGHMVKTEGLKSLFKGLSPGLLGIVPAKAIYFWCYANSKNYITKVNTHGTYFTYSVSALLAGSVTATLTNPIWYIKTQLQLNTTSYKTTYEILKNGYKIHGMTCFFRGLSASYVGVSENIIYFLLYEELKKQLHLDKNFQPTYFVIAASISKITATSLTYPHEVIRVRLRQDEKDNQGRLKYRNFLQSFSTIAKEEGLAGLYGGFGTGLVRQLPNTAAVFLTYETILHLLEEKV